LPRVMEERVRSLLPYKAPFLFVEKLTKLSEEGAEGFYTFKKDEYFYEGHFENRPVTPGVILTECMAQIGLVSLGISFLIEQHNEDSLKDTIQIAFTESEVQFLKAVLPGERVYVKSEKKYWRMGKLKCMVHMQDDKGSLIARGELAGIMKLKV
jgi:3-hydroxyacyl-[acyl-carrier-protein] dehydratase